MDKETVMINFRFCNNFELSIYISHLAYAMNWIVLQVGVIGNLVHSSPNIKKEVLFAGALQPVIGLLRYNISSGLYYCRVHSIAIPLPSPCILNLFWLYLFICPIFLFLDNNFCDL